MTPTRIDMRDGATAYVNGDPAEIRRRLEKAHRRGWAWVTMPGDHRLDVARVAAIDGVPVGLLQPEGGSAAGTERTAHRGKIEPRIPHGLGGTSQVAASAPPSGHLSLPVAYRRGA